MNSPSANQASLQAGRRHFLASSAFSLTGLASSCLMNEALAAEVSKPPLTPPTYDLLPKPAHHPAKAKAMISLWMQGGPSHHDLFDPKPEMVKHDGGEYPGELKYDDRANATSKILASPWAFHPRGECGMELSDLIPHTAEIADDITLIRSSHTGVNNHGQSINALNSGRITSGRPSLGSWLTYGLGAASNSLPPYLALIDPGQLPVMGTENWSNGWLPAIYQGTVIRPQEPRILNLDVPSHLQGRPQQRALSFLEQMNRRHLQEHPHQNELQARIATYELAAQMQHAAKEALDLSKETEATQKMYGIDDPVSAEYGKRCLIARRLIERGVRFVQVFTANQFWDHHSGLLVSLPKACHKVDKPSAALVKDLKQRGLLDETIVHWGGEMGRLPVIENDGAREKIGRDHNTYGFSMWVAGGGFKQGYVHGTTDDFGYQAVDDIVTHVDYHATIMHLFGLSHEKLTYLRNTQDQTITDNQPCRVVEELLA